jgi:hypothetical protein
VFDYLADFANIASWDPGVSSARLLRGEPGRTGAVYRVNSEFFGFTVPLEYEVLESVPPEHGFAGRVVLEAETGGLRSYDVITVAPTDGGCTVTYDADLALRGLRRPLDPFLRVAFRIIGDRFRDGLRGAVALVGRP